MFKSKLKSLVAIVMVLCIVLSMIGVTATAGAVDTASVFLDVKAKGWYKPAVDYSYNLGFISGMTQTEFGVNTSITRGMFITILARIASVDTSSSANKNATVIFEDVPSGKYYSASVLWAKQNGVASGKSETTFEPNTAISRQELCVMISNFANYLGVAVLDKEAGITFTDDATIAKWAKNAVGICQRADIVNGYTVGGKAEFRPKNTATRAEAAQILYKFHSGYVASDGDYKPPVTIPAYSGSPYAVISDRPDFSEDELTTVSYESYAELDSLKRCGVAIASIGLDIMPTEDRGAIGNVKPSGWHTVKYDIVDGKYLYNRCHLIGFQLSGENANEKNLITGTRYLNVEGMLPFENMVADYVKETGNHVAYRVTPHFKGQNLVAHGVQIEAYSIEDEGDGICFNVYCYNVQPGIIINYADGTSRLENSPPSQLQPEPEPEPAPTPVVVYDTPTGKRYHYDKDCAGENAHKTTLDAAQQRGLTPCKKCVE